VTQKSDGFAVCTDNTYLIKNKKLMEQGNSISADQVKRVWKFIENSGYKAHIMFLFASPIVSKNGLEDGPAQLDYRTEFK
jgi:hypothetical protein